MKDGEKIQMTQGFKLIHDTIKARAARGKITVKEGMKQEAQLLNALDWWRRQTFKVKNDFEGAGIAIALHAYFDQVVEGVDKEDPIGASMVTCKAGCNACCRNMVAITKPEAELLARAINKLKLEIDREKLQKQAEHCESLETYRELTPAERMCVFNGPDGNCQVYEYRPLTCRNYRVISDPKNCDTSRISPVSIKLNPNTEALVTATLNELERGALPALLSAELALLEAAKAAEGLPQGDHSSPSSEAQEGRPGEPGAPSSTPAPDSP